MMGRSMLTLVTGCLVSASLGCVSTEVESRRILRLGPLRGVAVTPAAFATPLPEAEASPQVLDGEERRLVAQRLETHVRELVAITSGADASLLGTFLLGTLRVDRCTLAGAARREATYFEARCWVTLEIDGESIARVEARARRRTAARALSEAEAKRLRPDERSPLLALAHSEAALRSSLTAAVRLLLLDVTEEPGEVDAQERDRLTRERAFAAAARARLGVERGPALAGACVDLGRFGGASDGIAVARLLQDPHPLVRRACADAAGELAAREAGEALVGLLEDDDEEVARAAATALRRVKALYPRSDARPGPSNSSTEGARDPGTTPAERRTSSM